MWRWSWKEECYMFQSGFSLDKADRCIRHTDWNYVRLQAWYLNGFLDNFYIKSLRYVVLYFMLSVICLNFSDIEELQWENN